MDKTTQIKIIGKNIKAARKKKGITQEELANRTDCSPSFLSEIETGTSAPSLSKLIKLAKALDITVDCILGEIQDHYFDESLLRAKALLSDCSDTEREFLLNTLEQIKIEHRKIYGENR